MFKGQLKILPFLVMLVHTINIFFLEKFHNTILRTFYKLISFPYAIAARGLQLETVCGCVYV